MNIAKGMKVKINPSIATREYLLNCYFDISISEKLEEISKGHEYTIAYTDFPQSTRDGKCHNCVSLENFGWIPKEALIPIKNTLPELKIGTILKTRGEQYYIVVSAEKTFEIHQMGGKESLSNWNKITGKHCTRKDFDIVAVYNPNDMYGFKNLPTAKPIWTETIPAREMTVTEIEKELGHGVKVVGEDGEWEF